MFKITIVGRPNVGKSTLFNRLLGRKRALVHDLPGVTRDRLEETVHWEQGGRELEISLVDTGGVGEGVFQKEVQAQVIKSLEEADLALWVIDARTGLLAEDRAFSEVLRKGKGCPVWLIVNKVDTAQLENQCSEAFELGIENVIEVSSEHNRGISDLKDLVLAQFGDASSDAEAEGDEETQTEEEALEEEHAALRSVAINTAILGRPNVGKSTLTNFLCGKERMIVSPIAGTTIDSVDTPVRLGDLDLLLIDTAGIRKKGKTEQGVEVLSVVQTKKALERAHIALLVIDGEEGVTDQDEKIGGMIEENGTSVILVVNKWDTQANVKGFTMEVAAELVRKKMAFLRYAPLLFVSAKRGTGFEELGALIHEVIEGRKIKITTKELTGFIRSEAEVYNPREAKFYLCHQTSRHPPTFVCHVNDPKKVHFSLSRHLVNALRAKWGFMGSPVRLHFIEGKNRKSLPKAQKGPARTRSASPRKKNVSGERVKVSS